MYQVSVVPNSDNNPIEDPSLNLPTHEEQSQIAQNNHQKKAQAQTNNLTRFGLNAYVLGAIEREISLLGR